MNKEHSNYRHPQHDAILRSILAGFTDDAIASRLNIGRRSVARVRNIAGIKPQTNSTTREVKVASFSVPVTDNHTSWIGRRSASGTPTIRQQGREISASHVVFEQWAGRAPVGMVKAECGMRHCLTPGHSSDELDRRKIRMQERELHGLHQQPWDICSNELHEWEEHGRLLPNLTPYCAACNTARTRRTREARKTEAAL